MAESCGSIPLHLSVYGKSRGLGEGIWLGTQEQFSFESSVRAKVTGIYKKGLGFKGWNFTPLTLTMRRSQK
jgi:hypothetical protein